MSIYPVSTIYPLREPPFFEKVSYDKAQRRTIYRLNVKKLSKDECHMFWNCTSTNACLIARALEFITFHPRTKLNEKFNVAPIHCGDNLFFYAVFLKGTKRSAKEQQTPLVCISPIPGPLWLA